jgi:hypothetical protein
VCVYISATVAFCSCLLPFSAPRLIFLDMWHIGELIRACRMLAGKSQGKRLRGRDLYEGNSGLLCLG